MFCRCFKKDDRQLKTNYRPFLFYLAYPKFARKLSLYTFTVSLTPLVSSIGSKVVFALVIPLLVMQLVYIVHEIYEALIGAMKLGQYFSIYLRLLTELVWHRCLLAIISVLSFVSQYSHFEL